jgi:hypothetical protein
VSRYLIFTKEGVGFAVFVIGQQVACSSKQVASHDFIAKPLSPKSPGYSLVANFY